MLATLKRHNMQRVLAANLPTLVLFVLIPASVYFPNHRDFGSSLPYMLISASLLLICGALIAVVTWPTGRERLASILFYCGAFLLLSDLLFPLKTGLLFETNIYRVYHPPHLYLLEGALLLLVVLAGLYWGRRILRFGAVFVLVLTITQTVYVAAKSYGLWSKVQTIPPSGAMVQAATDAGEDINIIHIMFDSFRGDLFPYAMQAANLSAADFPGFTYYPNTRSPFMFTLPSQAVYLGGKLFPGGSFDSWLHNSAQQGIFRQLWEHGYQNTIYLDSSRKNVPPTDYARRKVLPGHEELSLRLFFFDLVLLRAVPAIMEDLIIERQLGLLGRIVQSATNVPNGRAQWSFFAKQLWLWLEDELQDLPDGSQYLYIPSYLTHGPFVFDQNCEVVTAPGYSRSVPADANEMFRTQYERAFEKKDFWRAPLYLGNIVCTVKVLHNFLKYLQRNDRYENALIIVHSDHGYPDSFAPYGIDERPVAMGAEFRREFAERSVRRLKPERLDLETRALLMVKPPKAGKLPLQRSNFTASLLDIPATISAIALDKMAEAPAGIDLTKERLPAEREIDVFVGVFQEANDGPDADYFYLPTMRESRELSWIKFHSNGTWRYFRNLPVDP